MFEHIVVVVALLLLLLLDTDAREHRRHKDSTLRRHHHPTRRKRRRLRLSVVVVCIETPIVSQSFLLLVVVYLSLLLLFLFLRALLLLVLLLRLEREREREDVLGKRDGLRSRLRQKAQKFEAHDEIGERERDREERLLCSKMQCLGYYINPKYFFFVRERLWGSFFVRKEGGFFQRRKRERLTPPQKRAFRSIGVW